MKQEMQLARAMPAGRSSRQPASMATATDHSNGRVPDAGTTGSGAGNQRGNEAAVPWLEIGACFNPAAAGGAFGRGGRQAAFRPGEGSSRPGCGGRQPQSGQETGGRPGAGEGTAAATGGRRRRSRPAPRRQA
jgi:hypothetical protein